MNDGECTMMFMPSPSGPKSFNPYRRVSDRLSPQLMAMAFLRKGIFLSQCGHLEALQFGDQDDPMLKTDASESSELSGFHGSGHTKLLEQYTPAPRLDQR